jgi:tryptophan synthase beta chain
VFKSLSHIEGMLPAAESARAISYVLKAVPDQRNKTVVVYLSERGDKDIATAMKALRL